MSTEWRYRNVVVQTLLFLTFSSIPLWAVFLFDKIVGKEISDSTIVVLGNFVSICIPILVFGMASSKPTKEKGAFKMWWAIRVLTYSLSVIFVIAVEVVSLNIVPFHENIYWSIPTAIAVFLVTICSVFLQNKETMIKDFDIESSRKKEQDQAEKGAFDD